MKQIKRILLPMMLVAGLSSATAVSASPMMATYQVAAVAQQGMELHKTDRHNGDANQNGKVDSRDSVGVNTLGDNTNDGYDNNDASERTFDSTFWVLLSILIIGIAGIIAYFVRRNQPVTHSRY